MAYLRLPGHCHSGKKDLRGTGLVEDRLTCRILVAAEHVLLRVLANRKFGNNPLECDVERANAAEVRAHPSPLGCDSRLTSGRGLTRRAFPHAVPRVPRPMLVTKF